MRFFTTFIFLLSFAVSAQAGVIFKMDQKQLSPEEASEIIGKVEGNKLKMDFYREGNLEGSMIYRGDRKEMITIDHKNQSYFVIDKPTMEQLVKQMEGAMAQYEEAMKNVPPEYRKMMEEKLKQQMPGAVAGGNYVEPVIKEAGSGTISGYDCTRYDVYSGSDKVSQFCVTSWGNIEGGNEVRTVMLEMADFMEQMTKSLTKRDSGPFGSAISFNRDLFSQLRRLDGFPVQTLDYDNKGAVDSESIFKSSEKTGVDPAVFEPEARYKKQSMNMR